MSVRSYPGRRPKKMGHALWLVSVVLLGLTGLMFVGFGEAVPLFAQGTLVLTVVWLLFLGFDSLFPGVVLRRPRAASVGDDGVQTEQKFLPWREVERVSREAQPMTFRQMKGCSRASRGPCVARNRWKEVLGAGSNEGR